MSELAKHYSLLLGLDAAWEVSDVSLSLEGKCVEVLVTHKGGGVTCPQCQCKCSLADHAPERTWRHLDAMQCETRLRARVPRANCKACGVKTTTVPWAGKHSRFTLMFEALAIEVIQACGNVKAAALQFCHRAKGQAGVAEQSDLAAEFSRRRALGRR